jgi:hypothetical protein
MKIPLDRRVSEKALEEYPAKISEPNSSGYQNVKPNVKKRARYGST